MTEKRNKNHLSKQNSSNSEFDKTVVFDILSNLSNKKIFPRSPLTPKTDESLKRYAFLLDYLKNYHQLAKNQINEAKKSEEKEISSRASNKIYQNENEIQNVLPEIKSNVKNKNEFKNNFIHANKKVYQNNNSLEELRKRNKDKNTQNTPEIFRNKNEIHIKRKPNKIENEKKRIVKIQYDNEEFGIRGVNFVEQFI